MFGTRGMAAAALASAVLLGRGAQANHARQTTAAAPHRQSWRRLRRRKRRARAPYRHPKETLLFRWSEMSVLESVGRNRAG